MYCFAVHFYYDLLSSTFRWWKHLARRTVGVDFGGINLCARILSWKSFRKWNRREDSSTFTWKWTREVANYVLHMRDGTTIPVGLQALVLAKISPLQHNRFLYVLPPATQARSRVNTSYSLDAWLFEILCVHTKCCKHAHLNHGLAIVLLLTAYQASMVKHLAPDRHDIRVAPTRLKSAKTCTADIPIF
jgi:hypothetical protein